MISNIKEFIKVLVRGPAADDALRKAVTARQLSIKKVIHVGAHHGQEYSFYETLGAQEILWIEASPKTFRKLEKAINSKRNPAIRSVCVNAFASEAEGQSVELRHCSNDGASSSIFAMTDHAKSRWTGVEETGQSETVQTATLDTLAGQTGFRDADLLVIDVQGAELLVLKGAALVLRNVQAIVSEVSSKQFYVGGVLQPELTAMLKSHGFEPRSRTPSHGDQLFVRSRHI